MTADFVDNYFKSISIGRPKSEAVFFKNGRKRFGKAFDELAFLIEVRGSGGDADPYELKNSSLDLSLYVGEYYVSNAWREFASWLVKENLPPPSEVLDLGCETGVLTCLYAALWPTAKVVGVEHSVAAITAARELAKRLGLTNVLFEQSDARQFLDANVDRFNLITATFAMHELLAGAKGRKPFTWGAKYERIEDIALSDADLHAVGTLKAVSKALTEDGILISVDRSPHLGTTWWYTQCLEQAGMKVSLARSYLIECSGPSRVERFPLTVARRSREQDSKTTPTEIISLATFKELSTLNMNFREDMADTFVRSIGPTEIMFEAVCEYRDGSGIRTIRLLKAPTLLVVHDFTNHGFQAASVAPLVALPEALSQLRTVTSELEAHCTVRETVTDAAKLLLSRLDCPTQSWTAKDEIVAAEKTPILANLGAGS
jgi:SAM-dependent methyltransferase